MTSSSNQNRIVHGEYHTSIIAANRARRPDDFKRTIPREGKEQEYDPRCFFCPGNEHLTPPEITRREENGRWYIRVFPNKFYAVSPDCPTAYGFHEVVVETEKHNLVISQLKSTQLQTVLEVFRERLLEHYKNPRIQYVAIFKNEGKEAGASLSHTHSQIMALDYVPRLLREEVKRQQEKCYYCDLTQQTPNLITENNDFVLLCPPAPRYPFETWIVPKSHTDFIEVPLESLAVVYHDAIKRIDGLLNFPPYNVVFRVGPKGTTSFHFHIEILPRLATHAGFELLSGDIITSMPPDQAAAALRT